MPVRAQCRTKQLIAAATIYRRFAYILLPKFSRDPMNVTYTHQVHFHDATGTRLLAVRLSITLFFLHLWCRSVSLLFSARLPRRSPVSTATLHILYIYVYIYNTIRYTFYRVLRSVTTPRLGGLQTLHGREFAMSRSRFYIEGDVSLICTVCFFLSFFLERIRELEGTCSVSYTLHDTPCNIRLTISRATGLLFLSLPSILSLLSSFFLLSTVESLYI